jgi:methylated-DNA-[protein]-cysteine S-methyltransferase
MNYYYQKLSTPLGTVHLLAHDEALVVLAFNQNWDRVRKKFGAYAEKETPLLRKLKKELKDFLSGKSKSFSTPVELTGTEFQKKVWKALLKIPRGKTLSYLEQATQLKMPTSVRAVARANALNPVCILYPCHRVISKSGKLSGYAGGLPAKELLLNLEGA